MSVITVYSMNGCAACNSAINLLKSKEVVYEVVKVDEDVAAYEFFKKQGHKSVPQIYKDGELVQGGYAGLVKLNQEGNL